MERWRGGGEDDSKEVAEVRVRICTFYFAYSAYVALRGTKKGDTLAESRFGEKLSY